MLVSAGYTTFVHATVQLRSVDTSAVGVWHGEQWAFNSKADILRCARSLQEHPSTHNQTSHTTQINNHENCKYLHTTYERWTNMWTNMFINFRWWHVSRTDRIRQWDSKWWSYNHAYIWPIWLGVPTWCKGRKLMQFIHYVTAILLM